MRSRILDVILAALLAGALSLAMGLVQAMLWPHHIDHHSHPAHVEVTDGAAG
ncbi:MAG: hypothetical protein AAFV53_10930 [Myxococcota bacterium]